MHHFATRPSRFVLAPAVRPQRVHTVLEAPSRARAPRRSGSADQVAGGKFDLLGYKSLIFSDTGDAEPIDWHFDPVHRRRAPQSYWSRVPYLEPSCGDHKVVWELNRHQSWLQLGRAYWLTGDDRYRDVFIGHLDSWMRANPPLSGVNWASMLELALRSISWVWALHFFALEESAGARDRSPWSVDLLLGLDRQLTLVERNLSRYFSPNTHLLGEALALYVAGRALPELRRAATVGAAGPFGARRAGRQADRGRRRSRGALNPLPPVHARLLSPRARHRATHGRSAGGCLRGRR